MSMNAIGAKPGMTIADAERVFQEAGPGYAQDVAAFLPICKAAAEKNQRGEVVALPVINHLRKLCVAQGIINATRHSFRMFTGSDYLVRMLYDNFRTMLQRMNSYGQTAHVIVVNGSATGFQNLSQECGNLRFVQAVSRDRTHALDCYFTSDKRFCLEEEGNMPLHSNAPANCNPGKLYLQDSITSLMNRRFGAQWSALTDEDLPAC